MFAVRVAVIELRYLDTVTIKHKDTKSFLHSHLDRYPLQYEDGRISSQGRFRLQGFRKGPKLIDLATCS
jgi:dolichyl-phosphate-mannose--protein O-mannosyl transferase